MILETAVGRARWCVQASAWREATTQQAGACKEERQSQALDWACQRVRSVLTQPVSMIEDENHRFDAIFKRAASGQLPFPG